MKSSRPNRRPRTPSLAPEMLEDRKMMTGGVGSTFAIIPATISKTGGQVAVSFALSPTLFTDPGNKPFLLGIDVAPNTNSTANPTISSVTTPTGKVLGVTHSIFDSKVKRTGVQGASDQSSAVLVTIPGLPPKTAKSFTYKVNVTALTKTSGDVLVGFYLPGDADGTGMVNQADLNAIRYAMNTNASDTTGKYSFDADVNRDGQINAKDLQLAQKNLGVGTTVSPVISANVAPASMVDPTNRITNQSNITITGAATPNSTITYQENGESAVAAVADKSGNYSINVPLLTGSNTYNVTTSDAFKQVITGTINPITYNPAATAPAATSTATATSTPTTTTPTATTTTSTTPTTTATMPTTTATTSTTTPTPASSTPMGSTTYIATPTTVNGTTTYNLSTTPVSTTSS